MKVSAALVLAASGAISAASDVSEGKDRTITKVVKLLQNMLDKSKEDGDEERTLYGKYKCYCDQNDASKKESIASLTTEIGLLENQIDGLKASSSELSTEAARLSAAMQANEESRTQAQSVRDKENEAFVAMEADSVAAIDQMNQAIQTLSEIGADQTKSVAADHSRFMSGSGKSLLKLRGAVKQALLAASAVTSKKQVTVVESFLQAPFTGTYTAQAGEVVGILKDMRDTFTSNLASARAAEDAAVKAHTKYMTTMTNEYNEMESSLEEKQDMLSQNDDDLSSKRAQLKTAEETKADDESFLATLQDICAAKAKDYDARTLLRKNEEAALAEAISILNSDAAFQTFGEVDATKTGATSLLQRSSIREHSALRSDRDVRSAAEQLLLAAAKGQRGSIMLSKAAALLEANNPFTTVLEEIKKMITLIEEEEKTDASQKKWCETERKNNNRDLDEKHMQIVSLTGDINTLDSDINAPDTGIKAQIKSTEDSLENNRNSQAFETSERKKENAAYTKDISHLVEAEQLLTNAISVLEKYYSKILKSASGASLLQREEPAPPSTWDGSYAGQSAKGNDAISMLKFILDETKKEESTAHKDESEAQQSYEDSMQSLKNDEAQAVSALAGLNKLLAEKEETLLQKQSDRKATKADKEAIEAYLLKIKPGCDFIMANIDKRNTNRAAETEALNDAANLLKGTPAYQAAVAEAHQESLGGCKEICNADGESHANCKACLAKVTVPAYCAGHAGTEGC
eukprot:TRINITY_DN130_c0_g1_i1.p1 TRINITY_DN130_c0_g1~~TRINITY_DN130_c0_g1_i1.p1  ORF type:complete len:772 (+),score=264.31 TRINITY_DN130_c0_g1_i1:74-2317(+)